MAYSQKITELCEQKSNQVAKAVIMAAYRSMNEGQKAIIDTSGKVETRAFVSRLKISVPLLPDYYSFDLAFSNTEVIAAYDEPFGDLFDRANETAERYAEIAFNFDFFASTREGAIDEVFENFREAEKYVDRRIGVFI